MSTLSGELFEVAKRLSSATAKFDSTKVKIPLKRLEDAASKVAKSWCGSWLGYHSRVYYCDLQPPPSGARFSQEWGLMSAGFVSDTVGEWVEYSDDDVRKAIHKIAGDPNLEPAEETAKEAREVLEDARAEIISVLSTALEKRGDSFIEKLKEETESVKSFHASDFVRVYCPSGQIISRDMVAIGQGFQPPPHIAETAYVMALRNSAQACENLAKVAKRAASHLAKKDRYALRQQEVGTNIFIGHGRSPLWKDIKDFVQDRLRLPWDEFNRVPVAGITNIARLSQMLDDAAVAFLVMTAEDEQFDGKVHARMNVVHEAGLFQGRLGFTKAIVLLEEGCEEFTNIQGLGQIRFPKGNVKAILEEIRQVLEREGLLT